MTVIIDNGTCWPMSIRLRAGQNATACVLRKDASRGAEAVVFADLDISGELPLSKLKDIGLSRLRARLYLFNCNM